MKFARLLDQVEDLLVERSFDIRHDLAGPWRSRFRPMLAFSSHMGKAAWATARLRAAGLSPDDREGMAAIPAGRAPRIAFQ